MQNILPPPARDQPLTDAPPPGTRTVRQQISVSWEFPVIFTHHLFAPENATLAATLDRLGEQRRHRAMVFIDEQVSRANPTLGAAVERYFAAHISEIELASAPVIVPGGEAAKNDFSLIERIMRLLLEQRMDRNPM
jgi:3-dehydroquinate synthase